MKILSSRHSSGIWRTVFLAVILSVGLTLSLARSGIVLAQATPSSNLSVFFIVDDSGSMRDNDPQQLRRTAVQLFIALLDPGDSVAVVTFATDSEVRVPLTQINSEQDQHALIAQFGELKSDGATDMRAAFGDAVKLVQQDNSGNQKVIIFLTDGEPSVPNGLPPQYEDDTLSLVRQTGIPVLAIGLTQQGLSPFLGRIKTAGALGSEVIPASTSADLLDIYLDILGQLKDRAILGTGSTAAGDSASLPLDPALAPYVDRISFVAALPESLHADLISPTNGVVAENDPQLTTKFSDPRFAVWTMQEPPGGNWAVQFRGSGSGQARAIVRSRLRVQVVTPGQFYPAGKPMPIVVNLVEYDPPRPPKVSIGDATFSVVVESAGRRDSLDQCYDDGTHGDAQASDGNFTCLYVNTTTPGPYVLSILGHKGIVPVSARARVQVIAFPHIVIDMPNAGAAERGAVTLAAHLQGGEPPMLDQGDVIATISEPSGANQELRLDADASFKYTAHYVPTEDGQYKVGIALRGATYRGTAYEDAAQTEFTETIVPTIALDSAQIDLGQHESLRDGIDVPLHIQSTSHHIETVQVALTGLEGGSVTPTAVSLDPNADTTVTFRVATDSDLAPQTYDQARLIFTTRPDVTLVNATVPLKFEITAGVLALSPNEFNLGKIDGIGTDTVVPLHVTSTSLRSDDLHIASVEPSDIQVRVDPETITANQASAVKLHLSSNHAWDEGDYQILVTFARPRPQVGVIPDTVTIRFHVPGTCEKYCFPVGGFMGFLLASGAVAWFMIPSPRGTLVGLKSPLGKPQTYYVSNYVTPLKGYGKTVTVGSSAGSDIRLNHNSVGKQQALFAAQKRNVAQTVGHKGNTRTVSAKRTVTVLTNTNRAAPTLVNGAPVSPSGQVLQRGDKIQVGAYEFEYR